MKRIFNSCKTQKVESSILKIGEKKISFDTPKIMGILNITPDSFSDGGKFMNEHGINFEKLINEADKMEKEGAEIIDIGGESSGPGSKDVPLKEELRRVIPVVKAVRKVFRGIISVDTYKSKVASAALEAGADMINDVTAGRGDEKMFSVVARKKAAYCMMYSKDDSARTTLNNVEYDDVVQTVHNFLEKRSDLAIKAGIEKDKICIDPGMGAFISSDPKYSLEIIKKIGKFRDLGFPVLIGVSRKSFIGKLMGGDSSKDCLEGSLIAGTIAGLFGADIIRAHDVKETVSSIKIALEILR